MFRRNPKTCVTNFTHIDKQTTYGSCLYAYKLAIQKSHHTWLLSEYNIIPADGNHTASWCLFLKVLFFKVLGIEETHTHQQNKMLTLFYPNK